jgi:hypothetical protein
MERLINLSFGFSSLKMRDLAAGFYNKILMNSALTIHFGFFCKLLLANLSHFQGTKPKTQVIRLIMFLFVLSTYSYGYETMEREKPFVSSHLMGYLGNQMFQIAAASALAWDNNAIPWFPELQGSEVHKHVFFRCNSATPKETKVSVLWREPVYTYRPITYCPNMQIYGYFQSEKYFARYRSKLLDLFAPRPDDLEYIKNKYGNLLDNPNTVGVQIRYYKWEDPTSNILPQLGKDYLEKAMALFPPTSLFVVSSNNLEFAKKSLPSFAKNVVFLQGEPNYIDLYVMSMCKHIVMTNSSFGWWAAWLNQNPNKKIVCPKPSKYVVPLDDFYPKEWITLDAVLEK